MPTMAKMKLKVAIRHIHQYFAPLTVTITLASSVTMDLVLTDPDSKESVTLFDIPCRYAVTTAQLYQLINLIETQAKRHNPQLFRNHEWNQLQQG